MARGHGRILTSIWEDADFLTLTQEQQRLYLFLISQPNLNHAGLLPLTLRRWSRKAAGLTPTALDTLLSDLDQARFIVVDDDTEELLIRSFVRNDGVWKQPKVMGAMVSGAMEISSRRLRLALLAEVDRIPVDQLSDEPTKLGNSQRPSIRAQVCEHIDALRRAFKDTDPTPSGGGSAGGSETPSESPPEGGREASTRVSAGAHDARAPLPLPLPLSPATGPHPTTRARADEADSLPDRMLAEWWKAHGRRTAQGKKTIRAAIADALGNGLDPDELWSALQRLGETSKPVTSGTLQFALSEIRKPTVVTLRRDPALEQRNAGRDFLDQLGDRLRKQQPTQEGEAG